MPDDEVDNLLNSFLIDDDDDVEDEFDPMPVDEVCAPWNKWC